MTIQIVSVAEIEITKPLTTMKVALRGLALIF